MAIAKVSITEDNSQVRGLLTTSDGESGLIISGTTVNADSDDMIGITIDKPVAVFGTADLATYGITEDSNAYAYNVISEFYSVASPGTKLWVMLTEYSHSQLFDATTPKAQAIIDASFGKVRVLGVSLVFGGADSDNVFTNGISQDVFDVIDNANVFAKNNAARMNPFVVLLDGKSTSTVNTTDFKKVNGAGSSFVQVILGTTQADASSGSNAAVGLATGYTASLPVQRKKSRVKNGPLTIDNAYLTNGEPVEDAHLKWDDLSKEGYVFFITRPGKSGYYFSSDQSAAGSNDPYYELPLRRVMNKAIELAYNTLVNELDDEIPVTTSGKIDPAYAAYIEGLMDNQLNQGMVAGGELSEAQTKLNTDSDVLTNNTLDVTIEMLAVGYSEKISVTVGYTTQINE